MSQPVASQGEGDTGPEAAWRSAVAKVLNGASSDTLMAQSRDGLPIGPLYPKAELQAPSPWRDMAQPVCTMQRIEHPDPVKANRQARTDVEGGATGLVFSFAGAFPARGFGIEAATADGYAMLFEGLPFDRLAIQFEIGPAVAEVAHKNIAEAIERRGFALSALDLDVGLDLLGDLARFGGVSATGTKDVGPSAPSPRVRGEGPQSGDKGRWGKDPLIRPSATFSPQAGRSDRPQSFASIKGEPLPVAARVGALHSRGLAAPLRRADGRPYHEAGASEAQELAAVLATGIAGLRACEDVGLEAARDAISFTLVADADQFLTIAKFRALRQLWARVEQACDLEPKPIRIHAETAWRMLTRRDPHTNILRNTIAAASAILGGADSLTVLPHTSVLGLPDAFARRIARNTSHVLLEEANLGRVADPAAGAGGLEALTEALCREAWTLFQDLEREGGLAETLQSGTWQSRIGAVRAARESAFASGEATIVGVTRFALSPENRPSDPMPPSDIEHAPPDALPSWRDEEASERAP